MIENDDVLNILLTIKLYHKTNAESSKTGKNPQLGNFAAKSRKFF
jgi:hypothetical protein